MEPVAGALASFRAVAAVVGALVVFFAGVSLFLAVSFLAVALLEGTAEAVDFAVWAWEAALA